MDDDRPKRKDMPLAEILAAIANEPDSEDNEFERWLADNLTNRSKVYVALKAAVAANPSGVAAALEKVARRPAPKGLNA
jgi:predicted benzoate:H+ symporter BenE